MATNSLDFAVSSRLALSKLNRDVIIRVVGDVIKVAFDVMDEKMFL